MNNTSIIQWSEEDGVYIVSVPELPGCKTHGKTYSLWSSKFTRARTQRQIKYTSSQQATPQYTSPSS